MFICLFEFQVLRKCENGVTGEKFDENDINYLAYKIDVT